MIPGDQRGRILGFPTANLAEISGCVPVDGIYACLARLPGEAGTREATLSVGTNPTFPDVNERRVELHIHDFEGDMYGRRLEVHVLQWLRDTQQLASQEDLIRQCVDDVERSRKVLGRLDEQ